MPKHIVLLVHGMGTFAEGWSKDFQAQLKDTYESYPPLAWRSFKDAFEFVEINYNSLFDELRGQWKKGAEEVIGQIEKGGIETGAVSTLAKIAKEPSKDNFLATHVLDVLLYRFVSTVHEAIKVDVKNQVLDAILTEEGVVRGPWSVIAHSLGTSVAHDVLHGMYSQALTYKGRRWKLASVTRPRLIAMIANVSRVLESDVDVYKSLVKPSLDPSAGACEIFLNARHEFDPFTIPKAFQPTDDWPTLQARAEDRVQLVPINAIEARNVHALEHYFKNPKVHVRVLRALTWRDSISDALLKESSDAYELSTPLSKFDRLVQQLKKVRLGENSSWMEIIQGYRDLSKLIGDWA